MRYDVVVVGSGPAGSTAAYYAAISGLRTLIVDQAFFPRSKPCAGGLTTAALAYLPEPLPSRLSLCKVNKLSTWMGDRQELFDMTECFMTTIDRSEFDAWLLNLAVGAGATPLLGQRIIGYQLERESIRLRTASSEIESKVVIAADGANSLIARTLRHGIPRSLGYCLQVEIPGVTHLDTIEIHYGLVPEGYGWVFPRPNSRLIGVGAVLGRITQLNSYLKMIHGNQELSKGSSIAAHTIPIGGRWLPVSAYRVLLVGDAAGFADPFTGEGIRYALWSGRLAAQTARRALGRTGGPTVNHLAEYDEACRREIMPQLSHALRLSQVFFRFSDRLHPKLFGNPEPVRQLLNVLQGRSNYTDFMHWILRNLPRLLLP